MCVERRCASDGVSLEGRWVLFAAVSGRGEGCGGEVVIYFGDVHISFL